MRNPQRIAGNPLALKYNCCMGKSAAQQHKDYMSKIASRGGKATMEKHGRDHFANAGKKGAKARWKKQRAKDKASS